MTSPCPSGKVRHVTIRDAKAGAHSFARALNEQGLYATDLYGYRCHECRGYHLTKRATWDGTPNRPLFTAASRDLQTWAITGQMPAAR